jgi:hypothetical protein
VTGIAHQYESSHHHGLNTYPCKHCGLMNEAHATAAAPDPSGVPAEAEWTPCDETCWGPSCIDRRHYQRESVPAVGGGLDTAAIRDDLHRNGPTYAVTNDLCDEVDRLRAELDRAFAESYEHRQARAELNEVCGHWMERAEKAEADVNEWKTWEAAARGRYEIAEAALVQARDVARLTQGTADLRLAELEKAEDALARTQGQIAAVLELCDAYVRNSGGWPIPGGPPLTAAAIRAVLDLPVGE